MKIDASKCPECHGTGVYVGFLKTEPCETCLLLCVDGEHLELNFYDIEKLKVSRHAN
jgi:hypothetical protein